MEKLGYPLEVIRRETDFHAAVKRAWDFNGRSPILFERIKGRTRPPVLFNLVYGRDAVLKAVRASSEAEAYSKLLNATTNPSPPKSGSIEETHERVDVDSIEEVIPLYRLFPRDGGPYVTSSIIIAGDDEGISNASIHRLMFLGGRRFAVRIVPRHLFALYSRFKREGRDLPVAVLIGAHPALLIASATSPPLGVYEVEVANTLMEGGIVVDRLHTVPAPVPLNSDVILVGRIRHDVQVDEGPFVDITGTYDIVRKQPVLEVDEVWVRGGYTYHVILPGGVEHRVLMGFPREALVWDSVRRVVPEVKAVRLTMGGCGWLHAVISIKKQHEGDGKNVILAAFTGHPSLKHVVVVDEDIDVDNPEAIEWAIATRFRADRDLIVVERARGSSLDPTSENGLTAKMGLDATAPVSEREKYCKVIP